ncbi:hypothetical protein GCM10023331_17270 [Algivirga pacifica]|uniref:Lipoprotein n=1 Tax=Algivirga pacifica TaxID=1162670 RepID=A0ABP9D6X5_9BACT
MKLISKLLPFIAFLINNCWEVDRTSGRKNQSYTNETNKQNDDNPLGLPDGLRPECPREGDYD